ncbi:MBL fold metallo-hydrolase [Pseudonocardia sp. RS010]|uniref:MBL fold metallo-hydrolase n=1 Tax=Pseudonocardia sp. RS010 TaxID=3385979 RepID=UPI0039A2F895
MGLLGELIEIADGVFGYVQPDGGWWVNNSGLLVGRSGVTAVDSCATERRTRALLATVAGVSRAPVRTLVNTHHHGDHTYGNHLFAGATIVGHEDTRREILRSGPPRGGDVFEPIDFGHVELAPPTVTYRDGITLWTDDTRCEVRHVGRPAHTTNDSIVWLPEQGVLFAGDLLFAGGTPFAVMGSVAGALAVCDEVLRPLGATTVVPGHGPVTGPGVVDEVAGYLRYVLDLAGRARAAGLSPLAAAREADLGDYAAWREPERLVGNLHRAYAELDGASPGARIDVRAAMRDMVTLNGGCPLHCTA